MRRIIAIIVVLSAGLGVALYFQLGRLKAHTLAPAGGTGIVEGIEVDVTARIPSRIKAINVDEGDRVEAGQVLVELDCAEPRAALSQARAGLAAAEAGVQAAEAGADAAAMNSRAARISVDAAESQVKSLQVGAGSASRDAERVASMSKAGAISESRLDQARTRVANLSHQIEGLRANQQAVREHASAARGQAKVARARILAAMGQVEVARAAVLRAEAVVAECVLYAPRGGVVLSRNYEPGEAVLPGARLLTVVDLAEVRATFFLPNAELAAAAPGRAVTVRADAWPGETFAGAIRHVSARAEFTPRNVQTREDRDRLVYGVEIAVPNPDGKLRPGMPVEVSIDGTDQTERSE